jgi:hypothetical protein
MNGIRVAIAFSYALMWVSTANADCKSERQCDDAGNCAQVETCDDVLDMVRASPDAMTPIPAETGPLTVTPVAAAVAATNANCREVEICGTAQLVCD